MLIKLLIQTNFPKEEYVSSKDPGGLYEVIEDQFYKPQPGNRDPQETQDRTLPGFYLYSSLQADNKKDESSPQQQMIPGYSNILDTRLSVDEVMEVTGDAVSREPKNYAISKPTCV